MTTLAIVLKNAMMRGHSDVQTFECLTEIKLCRLTGPPAAQDLLLYEDSGHVAHPNHCR